MPAFDSAARSDTVDFQGEAEPETVNMVGPEAERASGRGSTARNAGTRRESSAMQDLQALSAELRRIDGRGYKAYKDILGAYRIEGGALFVDHVQADPFAAPSKRPGRMPPSSTCRPPLRPTR